MKSIFSIYLVFATCCLLADVPGNKPRPSYDIKITGLNQYNNHLFFVQQNNVVTSLKDSNSIHIQGGYGKPLCAEIWAINKNNFLHTDTLLFCSGDAKKSKEIILNIYKRDLSYTEITTNQKNKNSIPFSAVNNKVDNDPFNKNHFIMYLISGLSLMVLIMLLFFILKKKNKGLKVQRSI